jgi:hypothetical protein
MQSEAPQLLDEQRVRDQLSAAEELAYLGHAEPAVVAAGAALEAALRLSADGPSDVDVASILSDLRAYGVLEAGEVDLARGLLEARDRLIHGWHPNAPRREIRRSLGAAFGIVARLLEPTAEFAQQRSATG